MNIAKNHHMNIMVGILFAVSLLALHVFPVSVNAAEIELISVAYDGTEADGHSLQEDFNRIINADGRYIIFESGASNLILGDGETTGDTNGRLDVFVHDRDTDETERVSVTSDGVETDGGVGASASSDGRYVVFISSATDLVPNDTNDLSDAFIHDRDTGVTERVSLASDGTESNDHIEDCSVSADGRYVAFTTRASNLVDNDTNDARDIFVHDRNTGTTERVSIGATESNGGSERGLISADGRYVIFESLASNLVSGDTNSVQDIFVYDRNTNLIERISVASDDTQSDNTSDLGTISSDAKYIAFSSRASNLVSGDTNGVSDTFVYNRLTGHTERVSIASDGSEGNGGSRLSSVSNNGRYTTFQSGATNLISGDTNNFEDIFVHDRQTGTTERVSLAYDDEEGNQHSSNGVVSGDGRHIAFVSYASNLVPDDTNGTWDVFVAPNVLFEETNTSEVTLFSSKDSILRSGAVNRNEGSNPLLDLGEQRRQLVGFDLSETDIENVTSASLVFSIDETNPANQWGSNGRYVAAHRVLGSWTEGNGKAYGLPSSEVTRGEGAGVTWNCAIDTVIENQNDDCVSQWDGGIIAPTASDEALHINDMTGEVTFDVTDDVLLGADSWLLKKVNEGQSGNIRYYSRDNDMVSVNPELAPRLVINY